MLLHLTSTKDVASIRRSGIRPGKRSGGVYAMPVLPNYVVSHQWLRELKRFGPRTLSAVHFRIPDDEPVLMGHYSRPEVSVTAAVAAGAIMHAKDPLGMQIIIPRAIGVAEIHAIRPAPQVVGWRYFPGAHGRRPCGCPCCLARGEFRSRRIRKGYDDG